MFASRVAPLLSRWKYSSRNGVTSLPRMRGPRPRAPPPAAVVQRRVDLLVLRQRVGDDDAAVVGAEVGPGGHHGSDLLAAVDPPVEGVPRVAEVEAGERGGAVAERRGRPRVSRRSRVAGTSRIDFTPAQTTVTSVVAERCRSADSSQVLRASRCTPPRPPVAKTVMPAGRARCEVAATVVAPMPPRAATVARSRVLTLTTSSAVGDLRQGIVVEAEQARPSTRAIGGRDGAAPAYGLLDLTRDARGSPAGEAVADDRGLQRHDGGARRERVGHLGSSRRGLPRRQTLVWTLRPWPMRTSASSSSRQRSTRSHRFEDRRRPACDGRRASGFDGHVVAAVFGGPGCTEGPTDPAEVDRPDGRLGRAWPDRNGSGRFFGCVIGGTLARRGRGRLAASAWDQNAGLPGRACGCRRREGGRRLAARHARAPAARAVGFVTGAMMANFTCLAAARDVLAGRVGRPRPRALGAPQVAVVVGEERARHRRPSVAVPGVRAARSRQVPTDRRAECISTRCRGARRLAAGPTIVCLQAGNVHTGAFDPIPEASRSRTRRRLGARRRRVRSVGCRVGAYPAPHARGRAGGLLGHGRAQDPERAVRLRAGDRGRRRRPVRRRSGSRPPTSSRTNVRTPSSRCPILSAEPGVSRVGGSAIARVARRRRASRRAVSAGTPPRSPTASRALPGVRVLNDVVFTQVVRDLRDRRGDAGGRSSPALVTAPRG